MKKKILIVSCVAIAIAGVWSVNAFNTDELASNDLLMENVEALASGEGFNGSFNGQKWDTDKHWYNNVGDNWCPVMLTCTYVDATSNAGVSVSVGVPGGASVSGSLGYTSGASQYPGHYISCHSGSGNCVDGTSCVRD